MGLNLFRLDLPASLWYDPKFIDCRIVRYQGFRQEGFLAILVELSVVVGAMPGVGNVVSREYELFCRKCFTRRWGESAFQVLVAHWQTSEGVFC